MQLAPALNLGTRLAGLRRAMAGASCDALVVSHWANLFYLTNFRGTAGLAVVTADAIDLVADSRYVTALQHLLSSEECPPGARLVAVDGSYEEAVLGLLGALGTRRVGVEADRMTVHRRDWLAARLPPGVELVSTLGLVERLRARKDPFEVERLRRAATLVSEVADAVLDLPVSGRPEREVASLIDAQMRRAGFVSPAFDTIVGSGPNGSLPHAPAGDRRIRRGDLVVLDFGGVCDGYCADLTCTVSIGPAGPRERQVYEAVLAANAAARAAVRPGVKASDIDRAARDVLVREGLGDAFAHGTGHGLGIEVHEAPRVARRRGGAEGDDETIEAGMVMTIEPGAYLPDWGGVRIEDDVLVTGDGCDVLTAVPRDRWER